ncbi:MAG TPA: hypothetical protein VNO81_01585 [Candidatus Nitrosotenuis sp.]|nr:hypothetical protein [Candidatus Nitrosotenuis sp.]
MCFDRVERLWYVKIYPQEAPGGVPFVSQEILIMDNSKFIDILLRYRGVNN